MGKYQAKETDFKVPPADTYWLDLVWIESTDGKDGPIYKWHWVVADVEPQKEYAGAWCSSITSLIPTNQNRFGSFMRALNGALQVGESGTTEDLVMRKYRVKGLIEHNETMKNGEKRVYCNVKQLIEGTGKKGVGIGVEGAGDRLRPLINEYLKQVGQPLLAIKEKKEDAGAATKQAGVKPKAEKKPVQDLVW